MYETTLTNKTPERRHWHRSGVFIVNFEQISHIFMVYPLMLVGLSEYLFKVNYEDSRMMLEHCFNVIIFLKRSSDARKYCIKVVFNRQITLSINQ